MLIKHVVSSREDDNEEAHAWGIGLCLERLFRIFGR